MGKIEVAREKWAAFFNDFNKLYAGKSVKIEIVDDEDYRVDYAEHIEFRSVEIVSEANSNSIVAVSAGTNSYFYHEIDGAIILLLEETPSEGLKLIHIKSELGRGAIIRLLPAGENENVK